MTEAIDQRVAEVLLGLGVPHDVVTIDPSFADTASFCEKYGVPLEHSANTIIVASKKEPKQYAACVVKATRRLDVNHAVRRLMGVARLSFASSDETRTLTGMMIGGGTVLALPDGVPGYVDDTLMGLPWVILGSGSRAAKIRTSPQGLRRLPGAQIVPGLRLEVPGDSL